jgi:hypothetical protein
MDAEREVLNVTVVSMPSMPFFCSSRIVARTSQNGYEVR